MPERVATMRSAYEEWFREVSSTRGFDPPRIYLGTEQENPVTLTRQDWRGPRASWKPNGLGHWEVKVAKKASYDVRFRFRMRARDGEAELTLGSLRTRKSYRKGAESVTFEAVELSEGEARLQAILHYGGHTLGVDYVDVTRLNRPRHSD
jgi:hypothetical protein